MSLRFCFAVITEIQSCRLPNPPPPPNTASQLADNVENPKLRILLLSAETRLSRCRKTDLKLETTDRMKDVTHVAS